MTSITTRDRLHETSTQAASATPHALVDQRGMRCPLPLLALKRALRSSEAGQIVELLATDPDSARDIPIFVKDAGLTLLSFEEQGGVFSFRILK